MAGQGTDERVDALATALGFAEAPESAEELRRKIKAELRDLHPDRNGGDFQTDASRERFAELSNALARLDSGGTSLVPVETVAPMVSAILEAFVNAGPPVARAETALARRESLRAEAKQEAARRFRLSRFASGSVALVVSGLWAFPTLLAAFGDANAAALLEASIIAPVFAYPLFDAVTFGVALYAWMFFGLTWAMEQNDLARIDWATTDQAGQRLLKKALTAARVRGDGSEITKADVRAAIEGPLRPALPLRLLGARDVTASFLDKVADAHVATFVEQRALEPIDGPALSPRYRVAEAVAAELDGKI